MTLIKEVIIAPYAGRNSTVYADFGGSTTVYFVAPDFQVASAEHLGSSKEFEPTVFLFRTEDDLRLVTSNGEVILEGFFARQGNKLVSCHLIDGELVGVGLVVDGSLRRRISDASMPPYFDRHW